MREMHWWMHEMGRKGEKFSKRKEEERVSVRGKEGNERMKVFG